MDSNIDSDTLLNYYYLKKNRKNKRALMSYPSYTEDFFDVDFSNGIYYDNQN